MAKSSLSLEALWVAWQPVVDLKTGEIYGHEALIRGVTGSAWEMPAQIFLQARRRGVSEALELRCRDLAVAGALERLPASQHLFLNIDNKLARLPLRLPEAFMQNPGRLVIEVSEGGPILENQSLLDMVAKWRQQGHLIALDDYGAGYASAATVLAISPAIVKLDRQLVQDVDSSAAKQSLISSIRDYTLDLGIKIIAEGIETEAEYRMLRELHIDWGQGFWLGRPAPDPMREPLFFQGAGDMEATGDATPEMQPGPLDFYSKAIQSSSVPSYVVNRRRTIVAWNAAAAKLTGYASLVGERCFDGTLLHRDTQGRVLCVGACPLVWSMARRSIEGPHTVTLQARNGQQISVLTTVFPIWDEKLQRVVGAVEQFQPDVQHSETEIDDSDPISVWPWDRVPIANDAGNRS